MPLKRYVKKTPYRKSKKYVKKRVMYKKKSNWRPVKAVGHLSAKPNYGKTLCPFPSTLFTTFTYTETLNLTQSVPGTPNYYTFRANSLFDPNKTGTGHQPYGVDTLLGAGSSTTPYGKYRVHACKVELIIWPTSTSTSNANAIVAIFPRRSSVATPSSITEIRETPNCKYIYITGAESYKPYKLNHYIRIKNILSHNELRDVDGAAADYNANSTETVEFDIVHASIDGAGSNQISVQVTAIYYAELYTQNRMLQS